ncbi:tyrosinase cofactor [Streptomyces sp. NPDC002889]|uniref:apotyrosinase chaperone MelC1 n=1 Tax=Streptomyces sp. NPDC002889 TaxID=3364669 RepID=UPI003699BC3B
MSRLTRRQALGAVAGAAAGLAVAGAAPGLPASDASAAPHTADASAAPAPPAAFDEVYKGRRIQGGPKHGGGHHDHHGGGYTVRVDGKELHVMRNADGTWISVVNHYETFATPRAVARAAVVELQGAALVPLDLS